jgi:hypothetical protein
MGYIATKFFFKKLLSLERRDIVDHNDDSIDSRLGTAFPWR